MEVVAFLEGPTESISEGLCDRRLARSRNTHDHEDGSNASDVSAGGLDHVLTRRRADLSHLVGCRLGGHSLEGSTIAHSNHRLVSLLAVRCGAIEKPPPQLTHSLHSGGRQGPIASTDACDYWMFSPRRPQGKRQLCRVLRDGLAGVFNIIMTRQKNVLFPVPYSVITRTIHSIKLLLYCDYEDRTIFLRRTMRIRLACKWWC
jgi:hypothetical protein